MPADRAAPLDEAGVDPDPIVQFQRWFAECIAFAVPEPEAMCLATDADGVPSARMVLLRSVDGRGFVFHTNYESDKGRQLTRNPAAALVFRWYRLQRQVRINGQAERISGEESDGYFRTRPRGAQVGAWASHQSAVLASRAELEVAVAEVEARFASTEVPRPPWWGGIRVIPSALEFWQGREDRLHDRLRYRRTGAERWVIERLAP
jgi:pyridoxamine 5'-phosphate oxidase